MTAKKPVPKARPKRAPTPSTTPSLRLAPGPNLGGAEPLPVASAARAEIVRHLDAAAEARAAATQALFEALDAAAAQTSLSDPVFVAWSEPAQPGLQVAALAGTLKDGVPMAVNLETAADTSAPWLLESLSEVMPTSGLANAEIVTIDLATRSVIYRSGPPSYWFGVRWDARWVRLPNRSDAEALAIEAIELLRSCGYVEVPSEAGERPEEWKEWSEWKTTCGLSSPLHRFTAYKLAQTPEQAKTWLEVGARFRDLPGWQKGWFTPEKAK